MTRPPTAIRALCAVALSAVAACGLQGYEADLPPSDVPDFESAQIPAPPGVAPDSCWVRDIAPAEVTTVTRQVEVAPKVVAPDGAVLRPARFETETVQEIVRERETLIFETPCPADMTPEFIETLQRALTARGLYRGAITGALDTPTRRAIQRFQTANGLPSGLLSLQTARRLGLLATPRDQL